MIVAAFSFKRGVSCIQQIFITPEHFKLCFLRCNSFFWRERFIKRLLLLCIRQRKLHGFVKHLGTLDSAFATANVEEAQVPSSRQAFSSEKV
jgi:hypothetical protein